VEEKEVMEKREGEVLDAETPKGKEEIPSPDAELAELKDRYVRLYAEFDNYRKRLQKEKEELIKYGNESLLDGLLPVIDNLEMALKHATDTTDGLVKGVEITLRELLRVLEKFGVVPIPAAGRTFDPAVHHAMSQVERADLADKTVVEEFRKGYTYGDRVLRPSLVAVSKNPSCATHAHTTKDNQEIKED
jgi:molecular chaperone GrpE